MSSDNNHGFAWFLAGLGLGAIVGILYAPKSGAETRRQLAESANEGREYLNSQSRVAREQINRAVERSRDTLQRQREQFNAAVEAGKQAYREATTNPAPEGKKS